MSQARMAGQPRAQHLRSHSSENVSTDPTQMISSASWLKSPSASEGLFFSPRRALRNHSRIRLKILSNRTPGWVSYFLSPQVPPRFSSWTARFLGCSVAQLLNSWVPSFPSPWAPQLLRSWIRTNLISLGFLAPQFLSSQVPHSLSSSAPKVLGASVSELLASATPEFLGPHVPKP